MTFPYPLNIRECDNKRELIETLHRYEARLMELRQQTNKRLGEIVKFKIGDIIKHKIKGSMYRVEGHTCPNTYGDRPMMRYETDQVTYIIRRYIRSRAHFVSNLMWYSSSYIGQFELVDDPAILDKIKKRLPVK